MSEEINYKELDVVDPEGPEPAPESDYEVAEGYVTVDDEGYETEETPHV